MTTRITAQSIAADVAAGTSITAAGWSWIAPVNEILTLIATVIAIISGVYAIRYHAKKTKELKRKD
jgi:hypothetical protein